MRCVVVLTVLAVVVAKAGGAQGMEFSSSDAADATERMLGRRVHMDGGVQRLAGGRLQGRALTMSLVRDDNASSTAEGLKAIRAIEQAPAGTVVVVCGGDPDHAIFGATFATLARSRNLGGYVIDGAMRGLEDLKRIGVPVFARGGAPGSAGGHYRLASTNEVVECAGVRIAPGDLVVGDDDGVTVVPWSLVPAVLEKATALREEKDAMLALIARFGSYTRAAEEYRRARGDTTTHRRP